MTPHQKHIRALAMQHYGEDYGDVIVPVVVALLNLADCEGLPPAVIARNMSQDCPESRDSLLLSAAECDDIINWRNPLEAPIYGAVK